ncbi:AMT1-3, partial [Symbiodinium sp. KB8]
YGFTYGGNRAGADDSDSVFIGRSNFALEDESAYPFWFNQWAFALTTTTIVSGAVAGRMKLWAYFVFAALSSSIIYPIAVHWVWDANGWLNWNRSTFENNNYFNGGVIDFAGSSVIHMVGGIAGLAGTLALGPRMYRYDINGNPVGG